MYIYCRQVVNCNNSVIWYHQLANEVLTVTAHFNQAFTLWRTFGLYVRVPDVVLVLLYYLSLLCFIVFMFLTVFLCCCLSWPGRSCKRDFGSQ